MILISFSGYTSAGVVLLFNRTPERRDGEFAPHTEMPACEIERFLDRAEGESKGKGAFRTD